MDDTTLSGGTEIEFSLADLAALDASDIAEVRFESLPAGIYTFRGLECKFTDGNNAEGERRIIATAKMEVTECKSCLEKGYDKDELVGKKHTEKMYVVPAKAAEGLGLIRAFIGDVGLPNAGPFGGVDGSEPGILDAFEGHEFTGKIIKQARRGDPTVKDARLRIDPPKKGAK